MVKVASDPALKDFPTVNSFEVVSTNIWYVDLNSALMAIFFLGRDGRAGYLVC